VVQSIVFAHRDVSRNSEDIPNHEHAIGRNRLLLVLAMCIGVTLQAIGLHCTLQNYRVHGLIRQIHALEGTAQLRSVQTIDSAESLGAQIANRFEQILALCSPAVSAVSLENPSLDDRQLRVLSGLTSVESLELRSEVATDATLARISRLPNLQHLVIRGKQFTARGMLKLRQARSLRDIETDTHGFTPAEYAVLVAELGRVRQFESHPAADTTPEQRTFEIAALAMDFVESPL
jgi:hypothetical protein